jgi:hypothetical protein
MTLTNQQYRDLYKKLPEEKRRVIASPELSMVINEITKSFNLDEQKKDKVAFVIKDLLYEIYDIQEATKKIMADIGVDETVALKITNEIKDKILNNLKYITQTIRENITAENITNGIEDDYETDREENDETEDDKSEIEDIFKNYFKSKDFQKKLTESSKYIETTPKELQKIISDKLWNKRVEEIATKYSLTEEQSMVLQNLALAVIIEIESKETLGKTLETELGISELLTEQIMKDLDERVFQYAAEFVEKYGGAINPAVDLNVSKVEVKTPFDILGKQKDEVEIPPVILPMVESDEQRRKVMEQNRIANSEHPAAGVSGTLRASIGNPVPQSTRPVAQVPENLPGIAVEKPIIDIDNQIKDGAFIGSEFIQKPIAVPRFNAVSAPENPENKTADELSIRINNEQQPQSIIDAKLNSVTSASAPADKKPEVQYPPRYGSDPYREPIE